MSSLYHVARNGAEVGLFSKEDILAKLQSGELSKDCLIWTEGMTAWESISSLLPPTILPAAAPAATVPAAGDWGPIEAVKAVYWYRYADFNGRASRSEYWYSVLGVILLVLFYWLVCGICFGLISYLLGNPLPLIIPLILNVFAGFYAIVPGISLMVRRLHDINMSGWFYLLYFAPYVGGIIMFIFTLLPSKPANQWGETSEGPGPR